MADYLSIKNRLLSDEMNVSIPGTDRIMSALAALSEPQKHIKTVHVVGTNGKGSVSLMLSLILRKAGLKVGLFSSPYITELTEYIKLDNKEITKEAFTEEAESIFSIIDEKQIRLTHFEFITVLAIRYFLKSGCDICIFEAGLGGKKDATNVFPESLLNIITNVGLDHTGILGGTISEIIMEKCGICKEGEHLLSSDILFPENEEAAKNIKDYADENGLLLDDYLDHRNIVEIISHSLDEICFSFEDYDRITIRSGALYQVKNALTAIKASEYLLPLFGKYAEKEPVKEALAEFSLKARFKKIHTNPSIYIDGGHNPACIKELVKTFSAENTQNIIFVFGVMADKDYEEMIRLLLPFADCFLCIDNNLKRALPSHVLAEKINEKGGKALALYDSNTAAAYIKCFYPDRTVFYLGTLYISDEFRNSINNVFDGSKCKEAYKNTVDRLCLKSFFSPHYSLDDMKILLEKLGNPHEKLKIIHVAGTNGKGSTCSMIASVLREAGFSVGLFTSPYLISFDERIRRNGKEIEHELLTALTLLIDGKQKELGFNLNQFAMVTLVALLYYSMTETEYVVLETGLGGTYDPTNIYEKPVCTVITNIGMDHMSVLGNSIEEIAEAKAGIIKQYVPLVCYPFDKNLAKIFAKRAGEKNAPLKQVSEADIFNMNKENISGLNSFEYDGLRFDMQLIGDFQQKNAAVAAEAAKIVLKPYSETINIGKTIVDGINKTTWKGRLEKLSDNPLIYADGGHNIQCIDALCDFLNNNYASYKKIFIAGFLKDKDYESMIKKICSVSDNFSLIPVNNMRSLSISELTNLKKNYIIVGDVFDSIHEAYANAIGLADDKTVIIFTGSLYLLSDVYALFKK